MTHARISDAAFSQLVAQLYETLDDLDSWPWLLNRIADALGAQYTIWIEQRFDDYAAGLVFGAPERHEDFMLRHITRGGNALNPAIRLAASGWFDTGIVSAGDFLDPSSIAYAPEYVAEVLSGSDLYRGRGITALREGDDFTVFSAYFEDPAQDLGTTDRLLSRLAPHMVRAARSYARLRPKRRELGLLTADANDAGACLLGLDAHGRTTYRSENSERIVQRLVPGASLVGRRLELGSPADRAQLGRHLRGFAAGLTVIERMPLRVDGVLEGTLELNAIRGRLRGTLPPSTVALAVIHSRRVAAERGAEVLRSRFALTAAESDVLGGILTGTSMEAIARRRSCSPNTVRHQLESAMAKTGATNRTELAAIARRLA